MVIGCIAKGCENKQRTYTNVMFHRIPSNVERRNQWLAALAICTSTPVNKINQYRVCEEHFTPEDYVEKMLYGPRKMVLRLKDTAVPSIFKAQAEQNAPSTSTHVPISEDMPSIKCREYQTQHRPPVSAEVHAYPLKTSVGTRCTFAPSQSTPFSFTKQAGHARSRGVQAPVFHTGVSTETTQVETWRHLSSTPMKASTSGLGATPAKRPRVELMDEDEGNLSQISQPHDTTYEPRDSVAEPSETSGMDVSRDYTDAKYIVFESSLRELFETCPVCKHDCDVQRRRLGTFVSFSQVCEHCQYTKKWQSQPVRGSTPVGNLQMSAAVYFTGGSFIQMHKICRAMNLQIHQFRSFRKHARLFLEPSIHHKWKMDQQAMFQQLQPQGKIALSGDMHAVSPGHSAKYCSYTLTHMESNKILDIQLVQSKEVGGRAHMEKEGLRRGLDHLESNQLHVDYIVTDRHTRVQKYLRERDVKQYYGVWHLENELSKKLEKLSRNKYCRVLRKWLRSIKNHIYWSIMSSKEGPEKVAKWKSLVGHIQNVHINDDPLFPQCAHPDRVSRDPSKWFKPGSRVLYKVEKLLMNKRVLRDVEKLSHQHQTSALESFHSVIQRFAPKNVVFPFIGMLCRVYLAAMHFNESADREQAMIFEGTAVYTTMYPKSQKSQPTAKPTFGYVGDLMRLLFMEVFDNPATFVEDKFPFQFDRPAEEDVIAGHVSGFNPVVA